MADHFDVVIVGAGISGINAAYRLQSTLPHLSYTILEARESIGGTWDLFNYPGIRSDSDLFTFGYEWYPWDNENPIAEGHAIVQYMKNAAARFGIDQRILFRHRLLGADWSSPDHAWRLELDASGDTKGITARFLVFATGYYDYHTPLAAEIPGLGAFEGQVVHPQFWPSDLKYTGKKFVVIGSGATAITLVPKLAEQGATVTMLQRSPTYILSVPNSSVRSWLSYLLPRTQYRRLQRLYMISTSRLFFLFCRSMPGIASTLLRHQVISQLPKNVPYDPHFQPRYNPWDQRLCVCPDGDFFKSLHSGHVQVRTDTIRTVTSSGIELSSGELLDSDVIITATGLRLQVAGGVRITINGHHHDVTSKFLWHGMMQEDLPNAAFLIGYTNASWTLGADATSLFICRLLQEIDKRDAKSVVPRLGISEAELLEERPLLNLNSTYVAKAAGGLPKAGNRGPWQPRDHYWKDMSLAKKGNLDEGLEFMR